MSGLMKRDSALIYQNDFQVFTTIRWYVEEAAHFLGLRRHIDP
jgi:hypothetical protein